MTDEKPPKTAMQARAEASLRARGPKRREPPKAAMKTTRDDTPRGRQLEAMRKRGLAKAPIVAPAKPGAGLSADLSPGRPRGAGRASKPGDGRTAPRPVRPAESIDGLNPDPRRLVLVEEFRVEIPGPWQETRISSNDRLDKFEKARREKLWRRASGLASPASLVEPYLVEPYPFARLVVWYRFPSNIRREVSNLQPTSKNIVDGLVDAGLLVDDRDEFVDGPDNRREYPNGPHRVTVQVWTPAD